MKSIVNDEKSGKTIEYREKFWAGKPKLFVDGIECGKTEEKVYVNPETKEEYKIAGNIFTGMAMLINKIEVEIVRRLHMWEYFLCALPISLIAFGWWSAVIGIVFLLVNVLYIRYFKKVPFRILFCIGTLAVGFGVYVLISVIAGTTLFAVG